MRDGVLYVVEYPCRYDLLRLIPCRPICSRPLRIPEESGIIREGKEVEGREGKEVGKGMARVNMKTRCNGAAVLHMEFQSTHEDSVTSDLCSPAP
jgi:hypothetical protein